MIERLAKAGLDVNRQQLNGEAECINETPLHFAVAKGYLNCARTLIRHGADVNAR